MPIFFIIYVIFMIVMVTSIITKAAKQTQSSATPSEPRKVIVERKNSDFSFKFNNHTDEHSHDNQQDYQEEYSMNKMSAPERFQYLREKKELARIVDPPLSEAERNVLGGH